MRRSLRRAAGALLLLLAGTAVYAFWPQRLDPAGLVPPPGRYDVRILRDTLGRAARLRRAPTPTSRSAWPTPTPRTTSPPSRARCWRRAAAWPPSSAGAAPQRLHGAAAARLGRRGARYEHDLAPGDPRAVRGLRGRPQPLRGAPPRRGAGRRSTPPAARTWSPASCTSCRCSSAWTRSLQGAARRRSVRRRAPPSRDRAAAPTRSRWRPRGRPTASRACSSTRTSPGKARWPGTRSHLHSEQGLGHGGRRSSPARR